MAEISKVGVVGCGLMGHGIAQVAAQAGFDVVVREVDEATLAKGIGKIEKQLARAVERGKSSQEDASAVRERIEASTDYAAFGGCDLVIEAITEDLGLKLEMWREVDAVAGADAVFATNTSSLAVISQAAATSRPERFLGLHFFNPAQVMKLLEVVRCVTTSEEAMATGLAFGQRLGKLTVPTRDTPGFIVNRLLVPYIFDAIHLVESGIGSPLDVDQACTTGLGHSMGPLATADLIGLDTLLFISEAMFEEFGEPRFKAPISLRRFVSLGHLGRKSGRGYFEYPPIPRGD